MNTGKGPRLFCAEGKIVAPDMITFNHNGISWVEAKTKSVFSWHRFSGKWQTGIDLHHYVGYLKASLRTKLPVWLLFYHRESVPWVEDQKYGCPDICPTGLFAGSLFELVEIEDHREEGEVTDLIQRLRTMNIVLTHEAADELERLTRELETLKSVSRGTTEAARMEQDRLRAKCEELDRFNLSLATESHEFRTALERIARSESFYLEGDRTIQDIAREALAGSSLSTDGYLQATSTAECKPELRQSSGAQTGNAPKDGKG
jgi:hypothetical protein